jgi:hypothetical protein
VCWICHPPAQLIRDRGLVRMPRHISDVLGDYLAAAWSHRDEVAINAEGERSEPVSSAQNTGRAGDGSPPFDAAVFRAPGRSE